MVIEIKGKHAQITIFIVIAIMIVLVIIGYFLIYRGVYSQASIIESPKSSIDKCIQTAVNKAVDKVLAGGGRVYPELYIMYKSEKYNYLCYQQNFYQTCINHYPQLIRIIAQEIKKDTVVELGDCFDMLTQEYQRKGYQVSETELEYDVELVPKLVSLKIKKEIEISKDGNSQKLNDFNSNVPSSIYDLAMVAREISNQESQFCNFEYNGYMLLYPDFDIKRIDYMDTKIYKVTHRDSQKLFKFATRSCALPPGI